MLSAHVDAEQTTSVARTIKTLRIWIPLLTPWERSESRLETTGASGVKRGEGFGLAV
jgi:hypothetical protein